MAGRISVLLVHTSRIRKFTSETFGIEYLTQILEKPTGPEPMEVDDWICDEEMEWEPADIIEPMEWEDAFLPPQVSPSLQGTLESGNVSAPKTELDTFRRKKKALCRL
ncbi:hypothetical protein AVEN_60591-1 [Araneus ventricosus]|uniref:Uncharacterized protein n=1 Tax=Araneus ventricosus TaxID=182803 RepID=A0A4Y2EZJ2_ARAVE|nr:hypothetical protein AVEN_60591-1 [Araneus ventricosus]